MLKKGLLLLLIISISLLMIPSIWGADNHTDILNSTSESLPISDDIYFDCNASDDLGDGSQDNPYRELRDGRIFDNSVIHLKNGKYDFAQLNSHKNISIIGQDPFKTIITGNGGIFLVDNRFCLENITVCSLNILNQGNLFASNTIFTNSTAMTNQYGIGFGGAIYCLNEDNNVYLDNCSFINNHADFGGAIYLNGGILEAEYCSFIRNTAVNYGGAIACESKSSKNGRITLKHSQFIEDISLKDAGGAVYLKYGKLTGQDVNISNCNSTFGGAFTVLSADTILTDILAFNNSAKYDGGAIYQIYGNLTLSSALISSNHARNGAGLFIDNSAVLIVDNVSFVNNSAKLLAGAFYSLINDVYGFSNITYEDNTALEYNDLFMQDNISAIISSGNYSLYNHIPDNSELPRYYSSIDEGYVTPVKNQKNGGNCWAFAAIATIESALLKASGESFDLSEENMKNLAAIYSHLGWAMNTNEGGYDDMGLGYFTSWIGPVFESDEEYNDYSTLSPVLDSIVHVQNMLFLKKSTFYNLTSIKKAIRDYGAVYAPIYIFPKYDSVSRKYVQYYDGKSSCDHVVVLVGWDDDFYISGAPGKGAWIAKNSWGSEWGNNGYLYVSYFDRSCPKLGDNDGAIAFVFNDTMKYDKNYQYDIAKTDYFFNTTKSVWYKNIFNSTDNEYLAAVSTYFEKDSRWSFTVKVNNDIKAVKSGFSVPGYFTFNLDEFVPLKIGDIFEVIFNVSVDDGDVGVPISEKISLNYGFYHENCSFISYDGKNWNDLYNLTWEYPDHTYDSQVACIKAFTILNPINTTIALGIENRTDSSAVLVAHVVNQWGYPVSGNVTFRIGDEIYSVKAVNGIAKKQINLINANLSAEFNAVGYISSNVSLELHNPLIDTTVTLTISRNYNPINITANVLDSSNNPVKSGYVTFKVDNIQYIVKVSNGVAKLENINVLPIKFNVSAIYYDSFYHNSSNATESVELLRKDTKIIMEITSPNESGNPVKVKISVFDLDDNPVRSGFVYVDIDGNLNTVEVTDGVALIDHVFSKTGNKSIDVIFTDEYLYNSSQNSSSVMVLNMTSDVTFNYLADGTTAVLYLTLKNALKEYRAIFTLNNKNYTVTSQNGCAICEVKDLDYGTYDYSVRFISEIYEDMNFSGKFNISVHKTKIIASDVELYYNGDYAVQLKDNSEGAVSNREIFLTMDGKVYKARTNNDGIALFKFDFMSGEYSVSLSFVGDDDYIKSKASSTLKFKSTVNFESSSYSYNSKYSATLCDSKGKPLSYAQVEIVYNGVKRVLKSDANGKISLNIYLNPGTYSVVVENPSTGEVKFQKISVVKRITGNSGFTMYYGANKVYKVRVCDDRGNFVKGLNVKFTIAGKNYYSKTDKNGFASVKITQNPGTHKITVQYNGFKVSNKIVVKPTIITKNIKVKKGKTIKFTAKLLNSKGKILKNKKIIFKFKGKTYKIKTNKKGIATLKITKKYKKGKYTITSKYGKLTVKNRITIK